jgi:pyruvate dehydrogenase E1 component alpha subunit
MAAMNEFEMISVMDPEGNVSDEAVKEIPDGEIERMYRLMVHARLWNAKALSLQRQGRMGTMASIRGQEASNVGMGSALGPEDWFLPSFRETGTQIALGLNPKDIYSYWGGDERGSKTRARVLPVCITVGSHLCHGTGLALAAKIKGDRIGVLTSSGDGSTSQGDFHEALNFAGVFKLPIVFAIQNNHWAISIPVGKQTASETIAQKALAYGIDGFRVDGNDVLAVYLTVKRCMDAARSDFRPALVELVTYRMDDHTTADDASRYRSGDEVESWREKDPIDRMRKFLVARRGWNDQKEADLIAELTEEVEKSVREFESIPPPHPAEMFDYMYTETPPHLKEQRQELLDRLGESAR